jgi:DNA polymerase-4
VIVGGNKDRGVVAACSYETRVFMFVGNVQKMARQLCPDAIVLRGDFEAYSRILPLVTEIM